MSNGKTKRLGILTGGGDCPGLNAVIRAVAKSAMHEGGFEVIGIEDTSRQAFDHYREWGLDALITIGS